MLGVIPAFVNDAGVYFLFDEIVGNNLISLYADAQQWFALADFSAP